MVKILYVEDNFQNFRLVMRMLHTEGYEVIHAPDGRSGISMVAEQVPDLILMDINLPDIDGTEVTQHIKAMDRLAHIPVIALTANAMVGDRERFLAAGCDGYLRKPINRDELKDTIKQFLGLARTESIETDNGLSSYSESYISKNETDM